ncbi:hypothetical protein PAXINDRAFT_102080 [Paxillus involutus ATCC 200175]|uniref:Uncharacterized protein n=1 Tax=Paxillus involutus ATCC 200175 TaxID=664439 RepID=A0A0C9T3G2_PAXIN|nr:hypothetical protein PAXINDRAFT_102080 [Paxillus involutus ATCC 200175]
MVINIKTFQSLLLVLAASSTTGTGPASQFSMPGGLDTGIFTCVTTAAATCGCLQLPSLVGFGPLTGTQPIIAATVLASQSPFVQSSSPQLTRATTQLAQSASQTPASSIPNLAVTSTSPTDTSSNTAAPTPSSISITSTSSFPSISSSSSTPTDTDTSIPSIPTIVEPTPSPTVRSTDRGYGAPFYLAIVLGTLFGIACISAVVAWWIKSRARRKRHSELDPWYDREHGQEPSLASHDGLSSLTSTERRDIDGEMQTPEYYLPASLVRRSTTNLLALPYAAPTPTDERVLHNNIGRSGLAQGPYPPLRTLNNANLQMQSPYYGMPSSQVPKPRSRPNPGRLATGLSVQESTRTLGRLATRLSVQESTRTLGRLRVANIMPGDVTSGDEGGISRPGLGEDVGLTPPSATGGGLGTGVVSKDRDNPARATKPTPSPTVRSTDRGYGAPFYLAIVLGTLFGIACISAVVAWWIKSRARRKRHSELDPWYDREHGQEPSLASHDGLSSLTSTERRDIDGEMQTPEYYLPASLVRRSTTNLLALPYAAPTPTDERVLHNNIGRSGLAQGLYPPLRTLNNANLQMQSPYYGMPSSQVPKPRPRPNPGRLATGLSVQESTRPLGRLRVANIMPGDVTSGDEGGISRPGLGEDVGLTPPSATGGGLGAGVVSKDRDNPPRATKVNRRDRSGSVSEGPVEPPGPATVPWGRRTSTVAALRRTRHSPGTTAKTYKNPKYGGYYHQMADSGLSSITPSRPSPNPQGWTNSLKSSFWNAVEAVAGNRPPPSLDHEPQVENTGSGSSFTPAPRRALSQRSLDHQARSDYFGADSSISLARTRSASSLVARDRVNALHDILDGPLTGGVVHYPRDRTWTPGPSHGLSSSTLQGGYGQSQSTLQSGYEGSQTSTADLHHPGYGTTSTWAKESQAPLLGNEAPMGAIGSHPFPLAGSKVNATNPDRHSSLPASTRHPYSLRTETRSLYSTDSAAASANLKKYGYGGADPPLAPSPMPSHLALPIAPSRLTTQSTFQSDCLSTLSRLRSGSSSLGSANRTVHSENSASNTESSTVPAESTPFRSSSSTSARLVRKKGVTTQRKRPQYIQRVSSTASSMLSIESGSVGLSIREEAARRALLARRRLAVVGGAEKARI